MEQKCLRKSRQSLSRVALLMTNAEADIVGFRESLNQRSRKSNA